MIAALDTRSVILLAVVCAVVVALYVYARWDDNQWMRDAKFKRRVVKVIEEREHAKADPSEDGPTSGR